MLGRMLFPGQEVRGADISAVEDAAGGGAGISARLRDLWTPFLAGSGTALKRYEELAGDEDLEGGHEEVLEKLLTKLPTEYRGAQVQDKADAIKQGCYDFDGEDAEIIARFEARILRWLTGDRGACTAWLGTLRAKGISVSHPLYVSAVADYAAAQDYDEIRDWLAEVSSVVKSEVLGRQMKEMGIGICEIRTHQLARGTSRDRL